MAFAVRQTNMASLFIKTQLASDFLPQRHTFGEYGYFLATLQACFVFIMCLEKDDVRAPPSLSMLSFVVRILTRSPIVS